MNELLPDIPYLNQISLALVTFVVLSVAVMLGRLSWLTVATWVRDAGRRARLAAEADELARYADEVAVAAQRASATAQRHREHWLAALASAEQAARALDAADDAVRRLTAAAALPTPRSRTPMEYADRERYLHRAAMAACARGQLSIYQLSDALAHRNGWDPRLHPAAQELVLHRAIRDHLAATHAAAARRESAAWQAFQAAVAAAYSLRNEALSAAWRAQRLRAGLEPAPATADVPEADAVTQVLPLAHPAPQWQPAAASAPAR
ncbi:MAG: hypothetical protein IRZ05_20415 [Micromonosporaceae bacterium]|nr:hypothetical protein [Micromonosporaceae bacterium]